ncbi:MAG: hypothetical protein QW051_02170 [Candidatus Aenigmatarchaeota archaeon]
MDYWEKKMIAASITDPRKILEKDKEIVRKLKEENAKLKDEVAKLKKNNEALVKLVEIMENKIKKLSEDLNFKQKYVYSYEHGGWIEKDALDKGKIELASSEPSYLTIDSINLQLAEILKMIEKHKSKD